MSLTPRSIEPPILIAVATDAESPDPSVPLKVLQMLQRAWRNLPYAQWIMPPYRNHVQTILQILVGTTAIGVGVFADMRQKAMEILDKRG